MVFERDIKLKSVGDFFSLDVVQLSRPSSFCTSYLQPSQHQKRRLQSKRISICEITIALFWSLSHFQTFYSYGVGATTALVVNLTD